MTALDQQTFVIRAAAEADIPALHRLMRALAEFERYADEFAVTTEDLLRQGFRHLPPDFHALVAQRGESQLVGMLVYYFVPFTLRARPTLYIKELYVDRSARRQGVARALMRRAAEIALEHRCAQVKWQVARWNDTAASFYRGLGACSDEQWVDYTFDPAAMRLLAEDADRP